MSQRELLNEIDGLNENGISVLYIDQSGNAANELFADYILWDQDSKTLTHAMNSPIKCDDKPLVLVDTDKTLMGFYLVGDEADGKRRLDLKYKFYFRELKNLPAAPRRPVGRKVKGQMMDKDQFASYLFSLKGFID